MAEIGYSATLDSERLLHYWRWLCPQSVTVIDRNAFGDLFLRDEAGRVHLLEVGSGEFAPIAETINEFTDLAQIPEKHQEWFDDEAVNAAIKRGLIPGPEQCIGFRTPVVFAESGHMESAYVADLYDYVGFLGDVHRQIATLPDGAKVRLTFQRENPNR